MATTTDTTRTQPGAPIAEVLECIDTYLECDVDGGRAWTWDGDMGYWVAQSFHGPKTMIGARLAEVAKARGALFSQTDPDSPE